MLLYLRNGFFKYVKNKLNNLFYRAHSYADVLFVLNFHKKPTTFMKKYLNFKLA